MVAPAIPECVPRPPAHCRLLTTAGSPKRCSTSRSTRAPSRCSASASWDPPTSSTSSSSPPGARANRYAPSPAPRPAATPADSDRCQLGVYHHVTGVDASSSASLAAYINTLTHTDGNSQQQARVVEGLYWCAPHLPLPTASTPCTFAGKTERLEDWKTERRGDRS